MKYLTLLFLLTGCATAPAVCPVPPKPDVQVLDTEDLSRWALARQHTLEARGRTEPKNLSLWGRIGESREYTRKIMGK